MNKGMYVTEALPLRGLDCMLGALTLLLLLTVDSGGSGTEANDNGKDGVGDARDDVGWSSHCGRSWYGSGC
jgi:hypothetical protein